MTKHLILAGTILFVVIVTIAGSLLLVSAKRERLFYRRIMLARGEKLLAEPQQRTTPAALPIKFFGTIGRGIARSGILPTSTLKELQESLAAAGLRDSNWLSVLIGAKIVLLIGCAVTAILVTREMSAGPMIARLAPLVAGVTGLLLPDKVLGTIRDKHRKALEQGAPDALDLMVICTQAGLGLTATMQRVATEIHYGHPQVAAELAQTVSELQIAVDNATALTALGTRTGLDAFKRLATTLVQSTQYGTPLSEALRSLAGEMRQEALIRYEEKAARLPVLLTMPMIALVLPCIFIVVAGPAALQIAKAFSHH